MERSEKMKAYVMWRLLLLYSLVFWLAFALGVVYLISQ